MIRVLVVDDEPLVRSSLKAMTDWSSFDIDLEPEARNGIEALKLLDVESIDVVLLDMNMPRCDGIGFLTRMQERSEQPSVVVLSAYDDFALVRSAFTLGASDYLLKSEMNIQNVLEAIRNAAGPRIPVADADPADARLRQQLLRDLCHGASPELIVPLLGDVGIRIEFPTVVCQFRDTDPIQDVPGDRNGSGHRQGIAFHYLQTALAERAEGQFVRLGPARIVWLLQRPKHTEPQRVRLEAESLCRDVAEITAQATNSLLDWAVGETALEYSGIPESLAASDRLLERVSRVVRRAMNYIRKHYADADLSLEEVSSHVGVSRSHLSSQFRRERGVGFAEYVTALRIERARLLLEQTARRIYEVAEDVGFHSVEHFSRTFKKATGYTPNRYPGR